MCASPCREVTETDQVPQALEASPPYSLGHNSRVFIQGQRFSGVRDRGGWFAAQEQLSQDIYLHRTMFTQPIWMEQRLLPF